MLEIQVYIIGGYVRLIEEYLQKNILPHAFCNVYIKIFKIATEVAYLPEIEALSSDPTKGEPGIFTGEPWTSIGKLMTTCNSFCENPNCGHDPKKVSCVKEPELRETAEKTLAVLKKSSAYTQ